MDKRQRGFTLIELMIAVAIVAVISAIAYPSYTKYTQKSTRRTAQAQMLDIANREQQYLMNNRVYGDTAAITATGYALPSQLSRFYTWSVSVGGTNSNTFTITFTATGSQAADGNLTFTQDGVKSPIDKW